MPSCAYVHRPVHVFVALLALAGCAPSRTWNVTGPPGKSDASIQADADACNHMITNMRAEASPFENLHPYFIQCMTGRGDTLQAKDGTIYRPQQNQAAAPHFGSTDSSPAALAGSMPTPPDGGEPPPQDYQATDEYVLKSRHYGEPGRKLTDRFLGMDWLQRADERWSDAVKYCNRRNPPCSPVDINFGTGNSYIATAYTYALDAALEPDRFDEFRNRIQMACDAMRPRNTGWTLPTGGLGLVCVSPKMLQAAVDEARRQAPAVRQREEAANAEAAKEAAAERQALKAAQQSGQPTPRQTQGDQGPSWAECHIVPAPFGYADHPIIGGMAGCSPW
jgi:hypothetical protein